MNVRASAIFALVLIGAGAASLIYAFSVSNEAPSASPTQIAASARRPAGESAAETTPTDVEAAASAEGTAVARSPEAATAETPVIASAEAAVVTDETAFSIEDVESALVARGDEARHREARRKAAILWVGVVLPLGFIVLVIWIIILRRLRPRPMRRSGPSDTTDLWREAGRRMK